MMMMMLSLLSQKQDPERKGVPFRKGWCTEPVLV